MLSKTIHEAAQRMIERLKQAFEQAEQRSEAEQEILAQLLLEDMNTSHAAAPTSLSDAHPRLDTAQREEIVAILRQFGILHAALFGSFARGDTHATSDVDLLIDPTPGTTLLDLARLENRLTDALARPVQIVTLEELHPGMRERIQREQQELL
ncbi:MAG TPA: nucleotidyltransferase family protein [Ktedonobacterales bacterium]|nr:nucleotidyltransferase family protein [Ktedonobacterales bacterium]